MHIQNYFIVELIMDKLNLINRDRIIQDVDSENGVLMNRAERTKPISDKVINEIYKHMDLSKIGNYFDITDFSVKYAEFIGVDEKQMLITTGADDAIKLLYQFYTTPNSYVMYPEHTYHMYNSYTTLFNCNPILIDYDENYKINKNTIYSNLDKIKILFLPNPNHIEDNFSVDEISNLCTLLNETNSIMVVDETYNGFGCVTAIKLLETHKNLFIIRSFSKTFGLPGVRIGCLITNKDLKIQNYRSAYELSYPTYIIGKYFLDNLYLLKEHADGCIEGRDYLEKYLDTKNIKYVCDACYIFNIILENTEITNKIYCELWDNKIYTRIYKNIIGLTLSPIEYMQKFIDVFDMVYDKHI
jgi:histidinol-phosphate aminotransferase